MNRGYNYTPLCINITFERKKAVLADMLSARTSVRVSDPRGQKGLLTKRVQSKDNRVQTFRR